VYNNGAAGVFSSRNVPNAYANQRILLTGVIPGNGSLHNGILGCSFVLSRERKVNEMTYDLAQPFYIIAGSGPAMGSKSIGLIIKDILRENVRQSPELDIM
jgi:hypothetical protein